MTTKPYQTAIAGAQFSIKDAPATVEAFNQAAGDANACLNDALANAVYRTIMPKIWRKLAERIVAAGFPFDTKSVTAKDGTVSTIDVKPDKKWFERAYIALQWDAAEQSSNCQAAADEVGWDMTSSRGSNSGPTQRDEKDASELLTIIQAGGSTFARVKGNFEARNPGLVIPVEDDGTITLDSLAAAFLFDRRRAEAERKAAKNSLL
jgi:hypothetical protein